MIVISGALVLVAAVLLVLGIVSSITLVYAAIGLSLVSAVFLLVGVFQRPLPAAESREADEDTRAAPARVSKPAQPPVQVHKEPEVVHAEPETQLAQVEEAADFPLEAANADFEARAASTGADVLVVSGRPRYHVGGCEYVEGNDDSEPLEIAEARELGFTPCGVCKPNQTLALSAAGRAEAAPAVTPPPVAAAVSAPAVVASPPAAAVNGNGASAPGVVEQPEPVTAPQAAAAAPAVSQPPAEVVLPAAVALPADAPAAAPAASVAAAAQPAASSPPTRPRTRARARRPADPVQEPLLQEPEPEPAPPAEPEPPAPRPRISGRSVLAVAETKEYHRANCTLLADVEAEELTKGTAIRQGFLACGVCKP